MNAIELHEEDTTILLENGWLEVDGEAEVLGCPIKRVVATTKPIPVYIKSGEIKVDGKYLAIKGNTIPKSWNKLANKDYKRIFLYGDVDSGKSSLATYLVNKMDGLKYVLDLDIGQSDIAHPGAMGYGCVDIKVMSISQIKMVDGFFVGLNSPMGREAKCIRGVVNLNSKLKEKMSRDDTLIVDTTGWTRGKRAREYKLSKIEVIHPDVVVCFDPSISESIKNSGFDVFNVDSFVIKKRSREQRISIRSELYRKWLENAIEREFKIGDVKLESTNLFKGKKIEDELIGEIVESKVLFVEKGYDFLNVCVEDEIEVGYELIKALKSIFNVEDVCIFSFDQLRGLIVGLYSEKKYLGMGILTSISEESIGILTNVKDEIKSIEFGELKLEDMKEYIVRVP